MQTRPPAETIDLLVQRAECLYHAEYLTYTRVTNVCTGAVVDVPKGTMPIWGTLAFLLILFSVSYALWRVSRHD